MNLSPSTGATRRVLLGGAAVALTAVAGLAGTGAANAASGGGTATPAAQNNSVAGDVNADGSWTHFGTKRHVTTDHDNMKFTPSNLPSGGMCMRLVSTRTGAVFSNTVCWTDHSSKYVATNVGSGTEFTIEAHKITASGTDDHFEGTFYY